MNPPPYPAETRAKGWRFELAYEQIEQSDTWGLAKPEARPWLLMLWFTAWKQVPCGSLPTDQEVIAGKLGMPHALWAKHKSVLLRGWWRADDGRLYHPTLTERVQEMMSKRRSDSDRQAARRMREAAEAAVTHAVVTRDTAVTHAGVGCESSTDNRPPTTEHKELKTNTPRKRAAAAQLVSLDDLVAEGVDRQHATDWLVARKSRALPLTPTAWQQTKDEAVKAGMTPAEAIKTAAGSGWAGFKAKWLEESAGARKPQASSHAGFALKDYRKGVEADGTFQ